MEHNELDFCVAWGRNLEMLQSGALGDQRDPSTLLCYWRMQELAHHPGARENVEYFTALIKEKADRESAERRVNDGT